MEGHSTELRDVEFNALKNEILSALKKEEKENPSPDENLNDDSGRANVCIIHGESGTGKTRLARRLYNDHDIRENFDVFTWICPPPRVRFEQLVHIILRKVRSQVRRKEGDNNNNGGSSTAAASWHGDALKDLLKGVKYLVVLDELVDIGNWNCLLDLLRDETKNPGSGRILVTTQLNHNEIIKNSDPNMQPMKLVRLSLHLTTQLFNERMFGASPIGWEEEGDDHFPTRVHRVTGGLPLAVMVLAGILRTKAYPGEWNQVFADKLEMSIMVPKATRCLWLLALEDLPDQLKLCFLYLATAPERIRLDSARMVRLWIAEGFVLPRNGSTMEEVALGYLKELVCRGLIEVVEKDARGGIKKVTVHSLLHSFVQAEAQESGFLQIHHNAWVLNPHSVRRLAIHNFVDSYVDIPDSFPKLRSILCDLMEEEEGPPPSSGTSSSCQGRLQSRWWPNRPPELLLQACGGGSDNGTATGRKKLHQLSIIKGSRFLRVIDLYGLLLETVPDEIGSIIHLRYLAIRSCKLSKLPASISKLDNLQTLDLRKTKVEHVTDDFWELRGLRHVLADKLLLPGCPSGHLKQLQTLTAVAVPTGSALIATAWSPTGCCPLNHMIYLRSLAVCSIPKSPELLRVLMSALQKMEFLVRLSLSGWLLPSGVFDNPSSRRLEELALHGELDSPPKGPFILPNLGKLTLSRSGDLGEDFVKNAADLPNLAEMELLRGSYGKTELVFNKGGFPSLTKLTLNNLAQLEELRLNAGSVPLLTILTYSGCAEQMNFTDDRMSQVIIVNRGEQNDHGEQNDGTKYKSRAGYQAGLSRFTT